MSAPRSGTTEIVLIDPRHLTLECLSSWLSLFDPGFHVRTHNSVRDAIAHERDGPSGGTVVLYNIGSRTAQNPDVAEDIALLSEEMPDTPVTVIAESEETSAIIEALEQGVRGYITTNISATVLVGAIHLIKAGGTFVPAAAVTGAARPPGTPARAAEEMRALAQFTPRQVQVLTCLRQGKANKTIAYELDMCESTVKVHVRHIMKKLKATNRTQVAFLTNSLFGATGGPPSGLERRDP